VLQADPCHDRWRSPAPARRGVLADRTNTPMKANRVSKDSKTATASALTALLCAVQSPKTVAKTCPVNVTDHVNVKKTDSGRPSGVVAYTAAAPLVSSQAPKPLVGPPALAVPSPDPSRGRASTSLQAPRRSSLRARRNPSIGLPLPRVSFSLPPTEEPRFPAPEPLTRDQASRQTQPTTGFLSVAAGALAAPQQRRPSCLQEPRFSFPTSLFRAQTSRQSQPTTAFPPLAAEVSSRLHHRTAEAHNETPAPNPAPLRPSDRTRAAAAAAQRKSQPTTAFPPPGTEAPEAPPPAAAVVVALRPELCLAAQETAAVATPAVPPGSPVASAPAAAVHEDPPSESRRSSRKRKAEGENESKAAGWDQGRYVRRLERDSLRRGRMSEIAQWAMDQQRELRASGRWSPNTSPTK